jgi:hypothetical protein
VFIVEGIPHVENLGTRRRTIATGGGGVKANKGIPGRERPEG